MIGKGNLSSANDRKVMPSRLQQKASDPATSVWVNASAGSGKTTVLTNRVVRLLLEGVEPERILCLTYTRAAAAEMALRITKYLSRWATCSEEILREDFDRLQGMAPSPEQLTQARRLFARVLNCPGGMRIRTIHAFCQEILHRFPIEAGVPPHFAVIEEADAKELQENVLRELLREAEHRPESDLAKALRFMVLEQGEDSFIKSMRVLLAERAHLAAAIAQAGDLDGLIGAMRRNLELEPGSTSEGLVAEALTSSVFPEAHMHQLAKWWAAGTKKYQARGRQLAEWLDLSVSQRVLRFDDYSQCFLKKDGEPYADAANKDLIAKYPDLPAIVEREAQRLRILKNHLETLQIADTTEAILAFGHALIQRYDAHKTTRAVLDFDDLVRHTNLLLHRPGIAPWVLYKLDGGVEHILVDEAQDTSREQWDIVSVLADEFFAGISARSDRSRTLFVVGDEKQSIFSFQRADPEAFASMKEYFAERIRATGKKYEEVPLSMSFRSAPAVLQAVDHVFSSEAVRSGVSTVPVKHQAFEDGKFTKTGRVEIWPLLPKAEKDREEDPENWELPLAYESERDPQVELARQIASKIKGLLDRGDPFAADRPVTAGDIMILLQRRGRFADIMVRALKEQNIPVTGVDRMDLVRQIAVMDLLALMQFALLPEDDLTLATVLRGPLLNMSEDHLMELAIGRPAALWPRLVDFSNRHPAYASAHAFLLNWLNRADFLTPFSMLSDILNEPCPGSEISGRYALWKRLGSDALDPIEELLNTAQVFSHRHAPSLQGFLHWLMAAKTEIKREQDRGTGQVRIMTVHASKGLEAPIVFLPDASLIPKIKDIPRLQWGHGKKGEDVPLYIARKPGGGVAREYWEKARQKQLEEYRRLLYVALTRAAARLYICGWEPTRTETNHDENWYNLVKKALAPLHKPENVLPGFPRPDIVFSDDFVSGTAGVRAKRMKSAVLSPLPEWVRTKPVEEIGADLRLVPSRLVERPASATPDQAFARGKIVHRLLQSLPMVEDKRRAEVTARFLSNPQHGLTQEQQASIGQEVLALLRHPEYAPLFAGTSRAEVPLVGRVQGVLISGQIDRLCITDDGIWVVDYKTNRPPPARAEDAPLAYRFQLSSYHAVLRRLYPDRPIRCFLLWTYQPLLMEIPENLMPPLLPTD